MDQNSKQQSQPSTQASAKSKVLFREMAIFALALFLGLGAFALYVFGQKDISPADLKKTGFGGLLSEIQTEDISFTTFESEEAYREYLTAARELEGGTNFGAMRMGAPVLENAALDTFSSNVALSSEPSRVSQTNVQVSGIDEPDIVKTDGAHIFYSGAFFGGYPIPVDVPEPLLDEPASNRAISSELVRPFQPPQSLTQIVSAVPPTGMNKIADIESNGELLVHEDTLVVLSYNALTAYDISDTSNPTQKWQYSLADNTTIHTTRLHQGKIYTILATYQYDEIPCVRPLMTGTSSLSIACTDIYHPSQPSPVDSTYTVVELDANTGNVEKDVSFVGSSSSSVIYMNADNLYISYNTPVSQTSYLFDFYENTTGDMLSESIRGDIADLQALEISDQAKQVELQVILNSYFQSLGSDQSRQLQNELNNALNNYLSENGRRLYRSAIVRISTENLDIQAQGSIPGYLLNQFAMDEYQGALRVATTVSGGRWSAGTSVNDVYVLDQNLNIQGEVLDMGIDERIYAVRFMADKGYVVTFRETDPFYVLDLSQPTGPKLEGELKIPGFSSYLHQLSESQMLGVGRQDGQVKLSLFDVSNPNNPTEEDNFIMDEYWSEAGDNHRAFLHDDTFKVFFIPAGSSGYVFSYENGLEIAATVTEIQAKRALFIDNYLYIVGDQGIKVLDENTWEQVSSFEFENTLPQ